MTDTYQPAALWERSRCHKSSPASLPVQTESALKVFSIGLLSRSSERITQSFATWVGEIETVRSRSGDLEGLPTALPKHVLSKREREQPGRLHKTRVKRVSNNTARCREDLMSRAVAGERGGLGNRCTLQHVTRFGASETLAPGTVRHSPYKVGAPLPFSLGSGTLIYPWPSTSNADPWCVRSYISPRLSIVSSSPGRPGRRVGLPAFALEAGTFMMKP